MVASATVAALRHDDARLVLRPCDDNCWTKALAFSPDGRRLAVSHCGSVAIHATRDGARLGSLHARNAVGVAFAPDGRLAVHLLDETLEVWAADGGTRLAQRRLGLPAVGRDLTFDPSGERLALTARTGVRLLSAQDLRDLTTLAVNRPCGVAFLPDGRLVTGGDGARVWSRAGEPTRLTDEGNTYAVAASSRGSRFAALCGGVVRVWDVAGPSPRPLLEKKLEGAAEAVALSPSGDAVLAGNDLWSVADGGRLARFGRLRLARLDRESIDPVAFSPSGDAIAGASEDDGSVRLWSVP